MKKEPRIPALSFRPIPPVFFQKEKLPRRSGTPPGVPAAGLHASSAGTFLCAALASRRRLLFFIPVLFVESDLSGHVIHALNNGK